MAKQHTEDVITSEEDIKSNARTQTSDPTKGQDIQSARTGASYRGDDYSFPTTPAIGNWQMPMVRGASFQEVIDNDLGDIMAQNALEENTFSPTSEYGNSWYDQFVRGEEGYKNLNEVRAMEQGLTSKIVSGALGFTGRTASSFVGTFVSAIAGIGKGIMNVADDDPNTTFMQGFVKNGFQEVADDWNTWWDNVVPNYKGRDYEEKNMFSKLFTATYWADQLNNMGFTTGTLLGVMASGGMGGAGLAAKLATSPKSVQLLYRLFSGAMAAIPEATMEGYQLYKEAMEKYQQELEPKVQQCDQELQQLEQAMQQIENMYHPFGNGENIIRIEEKEREYNEMMSALRSKYDAIKNERDNIYNDAEKRALDAGVMNTVQQIPLLTLSNSMGMMSWLRCPTMNANRMVKGAFGNAFRKAGTKKGISLGEARATAVREMLSEGTEEWMQAYSSNLAMDYYGSDYDPNASNNFARYLHTAAESFKNTAMDESAWEEALAGCIMGATGAIAPHRGSDGKMHIFQGGIRESWREAKDLSERSQKTYDAMNDVINNPEARNNAKLAIAHLSLLDKQMEMAGTGSTDKEYRDYSNMLAIKTIQNFANAGRLNDLDALVGDNVDLSDEELVKLSKMFYQKGQESLFSDENGENMAEGSKEQRDALRDKIKQRHSDMKRMIKDYRDAINEVDKMTGWQLGQDQLNMLTWAVTQQKNWKNRIKDMYDLPEFQDMLKTISANNQQLMEAAQRAEVQREKDIQSKKMTSRSMQVVEQAMQEREDYLNQMYNASVAFIEANAQRIERMASTLEEKAEGVYNKADQTEETGRIFAEVEKRKITKQQKAKLKEIREKKAKIDQIRAELNFNERESQGKWQHAVDDKKFAEYAGLMRDLVQSISQLENEIDDLEQERGVLKGTKQSRADDVELNALYKADEERKSGDHIAHLAGSYRAQAEETREKELNELEESGRYSTETDETYQRRKQKKSEFQSKMAHLDALIQQANETITQGEKARENEESVENIKLMGVLDAKSLEELMHRINSGNLLMQMVDAKNVNLFDQIAELTELLEEGAADPEDIEKFKNLLSDMKKCMHSYIATDKMTKQFVANPNNIKMLQDKVKNNVASEMAKQTVEGMNSEYDKLNLDEQDVDSEDFINEDDRFTDEDRGNARLDPNQLQDKQKKYEDMLKGAKQALDYQLMILNWDEKKRKEYIDKVIKRWVTNKRRDDENFDNFLTAIEMSKNFSAMFDDIIRNVNLQGIPLMEVRDLARQLFETCNLYAFSKGFHPIFLNRINDIIPIMQENMGVDPYADDRAAAVYVCVSRIYDAMYRNIERAKANNGASSNIVNGSVVDATTGQQSPIENPMQAITSNDVTRDGTTQIAGVSVKGNLEDVTFEYENYQPIPDGTDDEGDTGEGNPPQPPVPPAPPLPPAPPVTDPSETDDEKDDNDTNDNRASLGLFRFHTELPTSAFANPQTQATPENTEAEELMRANGAYQYVYQGKLKQLVEAEPNTPVYAARINGIGTDDMPVLFFFVKDKGKYQMIGYVKNQASQTYLERELLFKGKTRKEKDKNTGEERDVPVVHSPNFDGAYKKENGEVERVNLVLSDNEPIGYYNPTDPNSHPFEIKNSNGVPLRVLKVGNQGYRQTTQKPHSVSTATVNRKSFEEGAKEGSVGILWNGVLIAADGVEYKNAHRFKNQSGTVSVIYKRNDGQYHHAASINDPRQSDAGAKPLSVVLQDENNVMTKVFKEAFIKTIKDAVNELKKLNFPRGLEDYKNQSALYILQHIDTVLSNANLKKNFVEGDKGTNGILQRSVRSFNYENIYSSGRWKSQVSNDSQPECDVIYKDGRITLQFFSRNSDNSKTRLFDVPLVIDNNAASEDEAWETLGKEAVKAYSELKARDENGNVVADWQDTSINEETGWYNSPIRISINPNEEYKAEYLENIGQVADCILTTTVDYSDTNTMVGVSFVEDRDTFNNNVIKWDDAHRFGKKATWKFAANKEFNKLVITDEDGESTPYHFKRKQDRATNAYLNEWYIYSGEALDRDAGDGKHIEPRDFLENFIGDAQIWQVFTNTNGKIKENVLNECITWFMDRRKELENTSAEEISTPWGVWRRSTGRMYSISSNGKAVKIETSEPTPQVTTQEKKEEKKEEKTTPNEPYKGDDLEGYVEEDYNPSGEKKPADEDNAVNEEDDSTAEFFGKNRTNDNTIRIANGLYNGKLLFRNVMQQMGNKFAYLDEQLLDFIESNLDLGLRVKVLTDAQWDKLVSINPEMEGTIGKYAPSKNCVYIKSFTDAVTLIHEFAHAATVASIKEAMHTNNISLNDLNEVLTYLQDQARKKPELFRNIQGIENFTKNNKDDLFEMVAEVIANKDLQRLLKDVKQGKKTIQITKRYEVKVEEPKGLLQKFVNWIKRLFNSSVNTKKYRTETIDKLIDVTMFDKFRENTLKLGKPRNETKIQQIKAKVNTKIRRKSYKVNRGISNNGITVYNAFDVSDSGTVSVNIEHFLGKFNYDGTPNQTWNRLVEEFENEYDTTLSLNDDSTVGMKTQSKFFDFLKEKGYKGIDLITGQDLSFSRYATNERLISFKEDKSDKQLAANLNTTEEQISELTTQTKYSLKHCM